MNYCMHDCSCDGGRCSMKGCTYNCSCQGGMWVIRLDIYGSFISCTRTSDDCVVLRVQCMRLYLSCNGTSSTFAMVFSPTIAAIATGVFSILMAWGAVNLYNYTTYWQILIKQINRTNQHTTTLSLFKLAIWYGTFKRISIEHEKIWICIHHYLMTFNPNIKGILM